MRFRIGLLTLVLAFSAGTILAQSDVLTWKVNVRGEMTDNRDATPTEVSNFDLFVTPRVEATITKENLNIDCFYAPAYRYRSEPSETERDNLFHHQAGFKAEKRLSKVAELEFQDRLAFTDDPSMHKGGTTLRRDSSYLINHMEGRGKYTLKDNSFIQGNANYLLKRYKEDSVAQESDQDIIGANVLLWRQFRPTTGGLLEFGGSMVDYDHANGVNRDFDSIRVTTGIERLFNRNARAGFRVGLMNVEYADNGIESEVSPFFTIGGLLSSSGTELGAGLTYSTREADVYPFSSQDAIDFYLKASKEYSKLLSFGALAGVHLGMYDTKYIPQSVKDEFVSTPEYQAWLTANDFRTEGDELSLVGEVSVDYHIDPATSLKIAQRMEIVDSDVSLDFTRNTTILGVSKQF